MDRIFLSTAAVVLMSGAAVAADIPAFEPPPVVAPVPTFSWTGFYAGLQGGWTWGDDDYVVSGADAGFDIDGWMAGGHVGARYQWNWFVAGVEADIEWADIDGDLTNAIGNSVGTEINWDGSLRANLGVAFDRVLVYGTGGLAFAGFENEICSLAACDDDDGTRLGWTIGAGLDVAVTQNITAGLEYRFTDYEGEDFTTALFPLDTFNSDVETHSIRARVAYKFGGL